MPFYLIVYFDGWYGVIHKVRTLKCNSFLTTHPPCTLLDNRKHLFKQVYAFSLTPLPPSERTYFMDGPYLENTFSRTNFYNSLCVAKLFGLNAIFCPLHVHLVYTTGYRVSEKTRSLKLNTILSRNININIRNLIINVYVKFKLTRKSVNVLPHLLLHKAKYEMFRLF